MIQASRPYPNDGKKCIFSYGELANVDASQPPTRGRIWKSIDDCESICNMEVIIPKEVYGKIKDSLHEPLDKYRYYKVSMAMGEILSPSFMEKFLKNDEIMMISSGNSLSDNRFTMNRGILKLWLSKETLERLGLESGPKISIQSNLPEGRCMVTCDLTNESTTSSNNSIQRLIKGVEKQLKEPIIWLLGFPSGQSHINMVPRAVEAEEIQLENKVQNFKSLIVSIDNIRETLTHHNDGSAERWIIDTYEWISLLRLQSPRIEATDSIDSYLWRSAECLLSGEEMAITKVTWKGLMSSSQARHILTHLLKSCPRKAWCAFSINTAWSIIPDSIAEITVLRPPEESESYTMWEIRQ